MPASLLLRLMIEPFGILKLPPSTPFPAWLTDATLYFVARTEDEFSVMCPQTVIPVELNFSAGWRCLRVHGDLAFDEVGVAARLSRPLAEEGLSIFVVSTHDRDYVFVAAKDLLKALAIYETNGFVVVKSGGNDERETETQT